LEHTKRLATPVSSISIPIQTRSRTTQAQTPTLRKGVKTRRKAIELKMGVRRRVRRRVMRMMTSPQITGSGIGMTMTTMRKDIGRQISWRILR
jgi:hypothetical protein